ncbi:ScbA/BarX family gamma-butyrolactone biosynthesis protein [Streptomyces sp. MK7]|uniref:ScbA/BarX family gamma-butyrolactone biosynthesis protein n=1 Tax=Streptomyces sp. MK7 TaxID=3067635 RepID=UPI00292E1C49|nr:ScbA/BarX family gamma-butyrolactone biosynthesis protein [Streptomyces sp. MK7]
MQFARTLPRNLVHRAAIAEVFLTDAERRGEDEILLAAQLPRCHAFYGDTLTPRGHHDPLLLLEACRQAIFVVAHRWFGVPPDHRFLLRTVEFEVPDPDALATRDTPTEIVVGARIAHRYRDRSGITGLRLDFTATVDGEEAMSARIAYAWMRPEDYGRLRSRQRRALGLFEPPVAPDGPRVHPALVGRRDPANTVVSPPHITGDGRSTARVVAPATHPTLYDHRVDHVPGMLELEACRQLALTAAVAAGTLRTPTALPTALSARFRRFAEMDPPLQCVATPVPSRADVECALHQLGTTVAEARIAFAHGGPARLLAGAGQGHAPGTGGTPR